MYRLFPFAGRAVGAFGLAASLLFYIFLGGVVSYALTAISSLPLLGALFGVMAGVVDVYCLLGIVLSLLVYHKSKK